MPKLYITRHGQTKWNEERRLQGSKNSMLTQLGVQQAMWLSTALVDVEFEAIYSSPLERALTTAEIVRADRSLEINIEEDLRECGFGIWEGWKIDEISEKFPEEANYFWNEPSKYEPVNGEKFDTVEKRVLDIIFDIAKKHEGNVLIVAHGIVVKLLMNYFMDKNIETLWENFVKPTSLSIVEIAENRQSEVVLYGDTSHYKK